MGSVFWHGSPIGENTVERHVEKVSLSIVMEKSLRGVIAVALPGKSFNKVIKHRLFGVGPLFDRPLTAALRYPIQIQNLVP